jgi:DNA polymerase epsilon subunit 1
MSSRGRGRGRGGFSKGNTRFTGKKSGGNFRSGGGQSSNNNNSNTNKNGGPAPVRDDDGTAAQERFEEVKVYYEIDAKLGFDKFESNLAAGESRDGWLVNMHATLVPSDTHATGLAAVDYYFIQDDGGMFKATIPYEPYFYVTCRVSELAGTETERWALSGGLWSLTCNPQGGTETIVEEWLIKRFEGLVVRVEREKKWDLSVVSCI